MKNTICFLMLLLLMLSALPGCVNKDNKSNTFEKMTEKLEGSEGAIGGCIKNNKIYLCQPGQKEIIIHSYSITDEQHSKIILTQSDLQTLDSISVDNNEVIYLAGQREGKILIESYSPDGIKIKSNLCEEISGQIIDMDVDSKGNVVIWEVQSGLFILNNLGKVIHQIHSFAIINAVTIDENDYLYVAGIEGNKSVVKKYSIENFELINTYNQIPADVSCISSLNGYPIVVSGTSIVALEGNKNLASVISYGINSKDVQALKVLNENTLICVMYNKNSKYYEKVVLQKNENADGEKRKELVLSGLILNSKIQEQIVKFNNENEEYYITVNDYSQYENKEATEKMDLDIVSGHNPDINNRVMIYVKERQ